MVSVVRFNSRRLEQENVTVWKFLVEFLFVPIVQLVMWSVFSVDVSWNEANSRAKKTNERNDVILWYLWIFHLSMLIVVFFFDFFRVPRRLSTIYGLFGVNNCICLLFGFSADFGIHGLFCGFFVDFGFYRFFGGVSVVFGFNGLFLAFLGFPAVFDFSGFLLGLLLDVSVVFDFNGFLLNLFVVFLTFVSLVVPLLIFSIYVFFLFNTIYFVIKIENQAVNCVYSSLLVLFHVFLAIWSFFYLFVDRSVIAYFQAKLHHRWMVPVFSTQTTNSN